MTARGHRVAAITTAPAACVTAVISVKPDACLIDPRFSGGDDGLDAIHTIRLRRPGTAVIILASAPETLDVSQARKLGLAGMLSKDRNVSQIAEALEMIASGGAVFEPALFSRPRTVLPPRGEPLYELTPRENEVLRRIVAGQGTLQMAREMNISASTLRTYVKNLLSKLGTHSRLQAAALASREGLVAELSA